MDDTLATLEANLTKHESDEMQMLKDISNKLTYKETKMDTPTIENIFKPGTGTTGVDGLGMGMGGGGALGLVALLALLGRNGGVFGGANGDGGSAVNQLTLGQIQTALGDIKAAIPYNESQVQLALAGAQADINSNITSANIANMQGQGQLGLSIANTAAQIGDKIDAGFNATALATAQAQFATVQAINADGDRTRSLIQSIDKSNDSRLITAQANEIIELRQASAANTANHALSITMNNNQNQNQLQFQQQQQALNTLASGLVDAIQSIRATNQAINIGSGLQSANPTNTNTNVRA